ncbi:MAG: prepilin-type N-terminal cleavage/methylation domain-containing protein [Candidatus Omnitrophica bacterium]|nr:prepilin-type N-terminal cleavage/methylation domain-containing protein [Candidatus Omnitrophota bacterium]
MRKRGFTIIELLISLIIGGILILMIGAISLASHKSHMTIHNQAQVHNDVFYGFELAANRLRAANSAWVENTWPNPPWTSDILIIDNSAFAVYNSTQDQMASFVYLPDRSDTSIRKTIFQSGLVNFYPAKNGNLFSIRLVGKQNLNPFDFSTKVLKRN